MSNTVLLIGGCALVTVAVKAVGPVALGGRDLPGWFSGIVVLFAPALLAALVATNVFAHGHHLTVGANTAGVGLAGVVMWRTGSIIACVVSAAAVTALLRAL